MMVLVYVMLDMMHRRIAQHALQDHILQLARIVVQNAQQALIQMRQLRLVRHVPLVQ
jgi:hypothetical protein